MDYDFNRSYEFLQSQNANSVLLTLASSAKSVVSQGVRDLDTTNAGEYLFVCYAAGICQVWSIWR